MIQFEDAMNIIEQLGAISLSDKDGKYIYVNKNYEKFFNKNINELYGHYIWEIVPTTKLPIVLKTHKPIIAEPIQINNIDSFCSYFPIFNNNKFDGVLINVIFSGIEAALKFVRIASSLKNELCTMQEIFKSPLHANYTINHITGQSEAIKSLKEDIIASSRTPSTVLIEGETGVGKELVAHSIHNLSNRSNNNFVRINCSAIPTNLMESEFFGHNPSTCLRAIFL
ncbi:MAG: sigma 54-interacting transcriptional regulator [Sedimentibacter sp.]